MSALRGSFWVKLVLSSIAIILFFLLREYTQQPTLSIFKREKAVVPSSLPDPPGSWSHELTSLLEAGVYNQSDFKNNAGISPPYWSEGQNYTELPTSMKEWGPCYRVKRNVDWNVEIAKNYTNGTIPQYPKTSGKNVEPWDLANNCRPGFLIIGAGKCGTSVSQKLYRRNCGRNQSTRLSYLICFGICISSRCIIISQVTQGCFQHRKNKFTTSSIMRIIP